MAQYDFGTIDPATKSGTALATDLNSWRTAIHSAHKGASRPVYAISGTIWVDDSVIPWTLKCYDGSEDIAIGTINPTSNSFVFNAANLVGTKAEFDTACSDGNFAYQSDIGVSIQAYNATLAGIAAGTTALGGFRNKIIGGDFTTNPWQRGTSFTAPAHAAYLADRWLNIYSMDGVVNVIKTADAPTAAQAGTYTQHCLHVDVTTADASIAAGQYYAVQQLIEGLNAACFGFGQAGTRYVTLSFWHKHTKTGTYCAALLNSASDRSYVAEYTQSASDTWEKATITVPVDTTGTWLYDTGVGIRVRFAVAAGSTYQTTANTWAAGSYFATANQVNALDSTANNFKIALVQLEAGSVATPFETRDVGTERALCQRYYYRLIPGTVSYPFGSAYIESTTQAMSLTKLPVTMRAAPSALEQSGTATDYRVNHLLTNTACSAVPTFASGSPENVRTRFTVAAGLTAGQAADCAAVNSTAYLGWSAEL